MSTTTAAAANTAENTPTSKTPPRNNYAAPHTPIASIKRPRSSLNRTSSSNRNVSSRTPPPPMNRSNSQHLSPMHGIKAVHRDVHDGVVEEEPTADSSSWVGRKVDALFSPVMQFLNHTEDEAAAAAQAVSTENSSASTTADDSMVAAAASSEDCFADHDDDDDHSVESSTASSMHGHECDNPDSQEEVDFNPWQFIASLPPYQTVKHLTPAVALPPKDPAAPDVTVVLDLDETLVHCTVEPVDGADLVFPVVFHGIAYTVHVRLRPFLQQFLEKLAGHYEVVIFTASQQVYADTLLNLIDPENKYIHHRLFRDSCLAVEGNFLKDLTVLGRDLSKTVLVDNSPHAFGYQVPNGIPIESWFEDPNDRELLKLERFLRQLQGCQDVRSVVTNKFQCSQRVASASALFM